MAGREGWKDREETELSEFVAVSFGTKFRSLPVACQATLYFGSTFISVIRMSTKSLRVTTEMWRGERKFILQ